MFVRVETFGLQVVAGDVVLEESGAVSDPSDALFSAEDGDDVELDDVDDNNTDSSSNRRQRVHVVTPEDLSAGTYTLSDVVLPLVSHDSVFPAHSTAEYMHTLLERNGITQDMFASQKGILGGAYRRVVTFPQDMTWRCQYYSHAGEEINTTELTALKPTPLSASSDSTAITNTVEDQNVDDSGKYMAAVIEFSLPSGTYATMLLRELTKVSTDSAHHASLTLANEAKASTEQVDNDESVSGEEKAYKSAGTCEEESSHKRHRLS